VAGSDTEIRIPIDVAALPNSIIGADDAAFLLTRDEARRIAEIAIRTALDHSATRRGKPANSRASAQSPTAAPGGCVPAVVHLILAHFLKAGFIK
jgi:hypothetical protein